MTWSRVLLLDVNMFECLLLIYYSPASVRFGCTERSCGCELYRGISGENGSSSASVVWRRPRQVQWDPELGVKNRGHPCNVATSRLWVHLGRYDICTCR